jgi:hypothetical protein
MNLLFFQKIFNIFLSLAFWLCFFGMVWLVLQVTAVWRRSTGLFAASTILL